jgi:hypothetical protein
MNKQSSVQFTENKVVVTLYIDSSKTFMNLSTGALALTVTFQDKIVGRHLGDPVSWLMVVSWVFYLVTIGSSALYQYFAVKFLDSFSSVPGASGMLKQVERNPGWIYGAMLVLFFLGSLFLFIAAARAIP